MKSIMILLVLLTVVCSAASGEKNKRIEEPEKLLEEVEGLYSSGEYEACGKLVDLYLEEALASKSYYPRYIIARYYRLKSLLSYAFREEGYREAVDEFLLQAVTYDLDLDVGAASDVPLYIIERYGVIREGYLDRYSKSSRRHSIGLFGALVLEPTVIKNPGLLQPGLYYSYNLSKAFSFEADIRFPLQFPIWDSIRGQVGVLWMPGYRVEKIGMGLTAFYLFGLDNLETFTHSISFGGKMELISRGGFGLAGSAELLRLDLIFGLTDESELPVYKSINIGGESFLRLVFANINFYIFYTF